MFFRTFRQKPPLHSTQATVTIPTMKKMILIIFFFLLLSLAACNEVPPIVDVSETTAPTLEAEQVLVPTVTAQGNNATAFSIPTPKPDALLGISIGIDPGHQAQADRQQEAIAPGAQETRNRMSTGTAGVLTGTREYEITLQIARHLQRMLLASGAEVVMTRNDNLVNLSNAQRALLLNDADLDFALSLHCEGANDTSLHGSFAIVSSDVPENEQLAQKLLSVYAEHSGFAAQETPIIKQKDNPFLNWISVSALWLNMGCLSNPEDEQLLIDSHNQEYIAYAIYLALVEIYSS